MQIQGMVGVALWAVISGCATGAMAACPSDLEAATTAARYVHREKIANPDPAMSVADAVCARDKLLAYLTQVYGSPVGYKAGLTNAAVQKRFNYPEPVRGVLFAPMILHSGSYVAVTYGARPVFEADLVVEVKDDGINQARTTGQVLTHLSRIFPFIELPDLMVETPAKLSGTALLSINVGARLGVLGEPLAISPTPAFDKALQDMTVRLLDQSGKELDAGRGEAILGHPLNAVLWLIEDLKKSGQRLKKGDLLSLGSFSKLHSPQPGTSVTLVYEGLPGMRGVSVHFR